MKPTQPVNADSGKHRRSSMYKHISTVVPYKVLAKEKKKAFYFITNIKIWLWFLFATYNKLYTQNMLCLWDNIES